ncbi:MAG: glycosyl transferase [Salinivirgaceae bacterium]|nr:MAG: glycosyl transferase [Salinivirgaceae bacterium]
MDQIRFLIVRFSSIGDIVLTTPVVRMLKQQVKGAEIHYLTKKRFSSLVEHNPYVHKVHVFDGDLKQTISDLKEAEFDYVIDLHKNLRSARVKSSLGRVSFSFNKLNWKKWIYVQLKIKKMPDKHIVDRYLETTSLFDVKNDEKGLDYFPDPEYKLDFSLEKTHEEGYVVAVLGANHATKQIPEEKMVSWLNEFGKPVVLVGGPDESTLAELLKEKLAVPVQNACGKVSLDGSALLIKNAKVILTPDTGMMHIAAAYKKPIVSVWGNTTPQLGMYPYMPQNSDRFYMAEVRGLKCRPCSKIGYEKCPKRHFNCMLQQDDKIIVSQLNYYWNLNE